MTGSLRRAALFCYLCAAMTACGGGGGGGGGSTGGTTTPPTIAPKPAGPMAATANPMMIFGTGASLVRSEYVGEPGYTGLVNADYAACAGVLTGPASAPATNPDPTFTYPFSVANFPLTGIAIGKCTITFSDSFGQKLVINASVTTTGVVTQ